MEKRRHQSNRCSPDAVARDPSPFNQGRGNGFDSRSRSTSRQSQAWSADHHRNEANCHVWPAMTSFKQTEANRSNARKSTGPFTEECKGRSRCNAIRHGLTAETVIGTLEDASNYTGFEAAIIADYDTQSAVERELVLRLASLLWRLRRAPKLETGLFEIQADDHASNQTLPCSPSRDVVHPSVGRVEAVSFDTSRGTAGGAPQESWAGPETVEGAVRPAAELAYCLLRFANLPTSRSTDSADMRRPCGVRSARSCLRSTPWIAANRRKEGAVFARAVGNGQRCANPNRDSGNHRRQMSFTASFRLRLSRYGRVKYKTPFRGD